MSSSGTLGRYQQTYNSFSGVDMQVVAGGHLLAEIQGVSYTVTREKAPLYTMGSADPRSFSRGKRGIAGSMIFLVFDRSSLLNSLKENAYYLANEYELADTQIVNDAATGGDGRISIFDRESVGGNASIGTTKTSDPRVQEHQMADKVAASPRYHDQILPFDIILAAANEYGHIARMQVCNVEIMNCGSGMSIDDITTDESSTFVATSLIPWYRQAYVNPRNGVALDVSEAPSSNRARGGVVTG